jgi:hypothetical protein
LNDSRTNREFPKGRISQALASRSAGLGRIVGWLSVLAVSAWTGAQTPPAAPGPKAPPEDPTKQLMDPSDEVDGNAFEQRRTVPGVGIPGAPAGPRRQPAPPGQPPAPAPPGQGRWGVVLATFSDDGHEKVAAMARDRFAQAYPELAQAYVRSTPRGSVVMVGQFGGPQDPTAKPVLDKVKELSPDGRAKPFARVYLSRVQTSSEPTGPLDLANARRKFPKVNPLFTVQVAMWSDFDSDTLPMEEIRAKAETHARMLRMKGEEAYVRHDEDKRTSIVTIGAFDSTAYDPRSTLFSPPVERIFRQYPTMLVNGDQLLQPPQRGSPPGTPAAPQPAVLIEIPP